MVSRKIKSMMQLSNITADEIANGLGITTHAFIIRLSRNSFKVKDLIKIAEICGYSLQLKSKTNDTLIQFDLEE